MRGAVLAAYRVRGPLYGAAVVVLLLAALLAGLGAGTMPVVVVIAALCVLAVSLALVAFGPRLLPRRSPVLVVPAVRGRWLAMNSPASKVPSHGVRMYGQAHAIDLVHEPIDRARPAFGTGPAMRAPQQYPAFGQPVFAMIDGTVVRASHWRRDHRARSGWVGVAYLMIEGAIRELGGSGFILGNHVTIRGADGDYATVAHLHHGSLSVRVGESVRAGQQIGRCGNSGNSSEPHVHAQLMDRVSPWTAQGVPMVFAAISLDDGAAEGDATVDGSTLDGLPENGQHMSVSR